MTSHGVFEPILIAADAKVIAAESILKDAARAYEVSLDTDLEWLPDRDLWATLRLNVAALRTVADRFLSLTEAEFRP